MSRLEKTFIPHLWDKLCSELVKLEHGPPLSVEEASHEVDQLALKMYDDLQQKSLKAWKTKVKTWHAQSKELYHYLRNPLPNKCSSVSEPGGGLTVSPLKMEACLERSWGGLETWPTPTSFQQAVDVIDDVYSLFLPHVPFVAIVTVDTIRAQLTRMKNTTAGPDGWVRKELRALPDAAWHDLLYILSHRPESFSDTTLALFKRVPILKSEAAPPSPDNFRPIDVFSQLLRLVTSAQVAAIRPWLQQVLHSTQYASHKGATKAMAELNVVAESVLLGVSEVWAFTADFAKLYNTLSCGVAEYIAWFAGLDTSSTPWLVFPVSVAKGCWRMPNNVAVPFRHHERGMPQGLATSVVLSELCIAAFLWRLHNILSVQTICYVDDLTVIANSAQDLSRAYDLLVQFTQDLSLSLAAAKTRFWGSFPTPLIQLARQKGVEHTDVVSALGLQWSLRTGVRNDYTKEMARINSCRERLRRLAHLPANLSVKIQAIITGYLSLLSYSVLPESKFASGLRVSVRHALNQSYGAPECVFHCLCRTSADPLYSWVMACARLLDTWITHKCIPTLAMMRSKKALLGRVTTFLRWAKRAGWTIRPQSLETPRGDTIRFARAWQDTREEIRVAYRRFMAYTLALRRPALYEGLLDWNAKQRRRLINALDPHSGSLMFRIWSGSAMTASHAYTVGKADSPDCQCGHDRETVHHLVFDCPLRPSCPLELSPWKHKAPCHSHALLCPFSITKDDCVLWMRLCRRAISLLSAKGDPQQDMDWKGHVVTHDLQEEYMYCTRCLVTRKAPDARHIAARPCDGDIWGCPLREGDYFRHRGHILRLTFRPWKRAARRPALHCVCCTFWNWPSYRIATPCSA